MAKTDRISQSLTRREQVLGWAWMVFQLCFLPTLLTNGNGLLGSPFSAATVNFLYFSLNFIGVILIFYRFLEKNLISLGKHFLTAVRGALLGFLVYYGATTLLNQGIHALFPGFANVNDSSVAAMLRLRELPMVIGTVFLVPVAEEVLHRGLVFGSLCRKDPGLAYALSALLFCGVHVVGYVGSADGLTLTLCFLQYLPAALCLAWAYVRGDNIFAPILMHMLINAMNIYAVR